MDIRTDDLRVVDLADEFGITISETLALCKRFDIPAPYGSSIVSPTGVALLRGLAKGDISPDSLGVDPVSADDLRGAGSTDERGSAPVERPDRSADSTEAADDKAADDKAAADEAADDYDYGDPDDYDSYGVAGLDDSLTTPTKDDRATPVSAAGVTPDSDPTVPSVSLPTTKSGRPQAEADGVTPSEKPSGVNVSATRSALRERGPDRRTNPGRRPSDDGRTEYDPTKLRAEYDDIDKYVPRWLKFIALGALAVFGFLFYQLFFGVSVEVAEDGPQQTPIYSAGDCFNADIALWIDTMALTSCAGEHDGEVFDSVSLIGEPGVAYPEPATMTSQARQSCRASFSQYTGQSSFVSDYQIGVSLPTSIEWARGDRIAYCSTISNDGTKLTGSTAKP